MLGSAGSRAGRGRGRGSFVATAHPFNCSQLQYAATNLVKLVPKGGELVKINGILCQLPSGGISASPTSASINGIPGQTLTAGLLYYVYVFNGPEGLTLDFSTTGHATDASVLNCGIEIKQGDPTRTLVGMVFTDSGPAFALTAQKMWVLSWANPQPLSGLGAYSPGHGTSANTLLEISPSIRVNFVCWANQTAMVACNPVVEPGNTAGVSGVVTSIAFDTNAGGEPVGSFVQAESILQSLKTPSFTYSKRGLAEGAHFVTLTGASSSGDVALWLSPVETGFPGLGTTLSVEVR